MLLQLREGDFVLLEHHANVPHGSKKADGDLRGTLQESGTTENESLNAFDSGNGYGIVNSSTAASSGTNAYDTQMDLRKGEYPSQKRIPCSDEMKGSNSSERTPVKRSNKSRIISNSHGIEPHKSPKSRVKGFKEPLSSDTNIKVQNDNESSRFNVQLLPCNRRHLLLPLPSYFDAGLATTKENIQESNRVANLGIMRMMGMKKSTKIDQQQDSEDSPNRQRKVKVSFQK